MNVIKRGYYNGIEVIQVAHIISKDWRKIEGYKTRGYSKRVKRVGLSRMIKGYPNITQHVKRNRTHTITLKPTNLNEAE